jgi:YidC/Oxa1 family membrane protein insertase
MDFGIGFLSNNVMLPILDFFYGIVPSYGLAIVALTLVIRLTLYPLSAGSIRNMRRTRVTQPLMQKRVKELQERYKDNPAKLQEEMSGVYKEFGNPLAGCFPVLVQMPVLFALFATLRGSPFSDINYSVNLQIFSPRTNRADSTSSLCHSLPKISILPTVFMLVLAPLFLVVTA